MPVCPKCGHEWKAKNLRLRDAADLSAQIAEGIKAFGDTSNDVTRFIGLAQSVRKSGMGAGKTLGILSNFLALHNEDPLAFGYAIRQVLASEKFNWRNSNLTGYITAIYKNVREKGGPPKTPDDRAGELALTMIASWYRFAEASAITEKLCEDIVDGRTIYRLLRAMTRKHRLPSDPPPVEKLAGRIRAIFAWVENNRREQARARAGKMNPDALPDPEKPLPPELQKLLDAGRKRAAEREAEEAAAWGEVRS
jgi:hypothetical protein